MKGKKGQGLIEIAVILVIILIVVPPIVYFAIKSKNNSKNRYDYFDCQIDGSTKKGPIPADMMNDRANEGRFKNCEGRRGSIPNDDQMVYADPNEEIDIDINDENPEDKTKDEPSLPGGGEVT